MRFLYLISLFVSLAATALAQTGNSPGVTTQPAFPTAEQSLTLTIDLTQAKDSRAKALLGKKDDVYLWSGAGPTETGDAFRYQPTGQTDFSKPFEPGKMTTLGNDRWQIVLTPRTYYNVPATDVIRRLGLVVKSGDGKAQTEDLYARIYDSKLSILRIEPSQRDFYVDANATLTVRYKTSRQVSLRLTLDGQPVLTALNTDSLRTSLNTGTQTGLRRTVILQASTMTSPTGESAADTFYFTVKPQPIIASLPAGLKDGINYTSAINATLVLFAPLKSFVYLIGEFNNWQPSAQYLMNRTPDGNRYWLELPGLKPGQEVAFQYLVDGQIAVADPYAEKILDRNNDKFLTAATYPNLKPFPADAPGNIVSVLQSGQAAYAWKSASFKRPNSNNLVIYELLVRDFSASLTYKAVADSLPYLKQLGINAIELMPIMEFSGNDSWGYNPIFYFAPDKAYGTKDDLKAFIDKCHENGIAVLLDMVLNQADYEFPYVKLYFDGDRPATNSPFFNPQATHPFSVFFDFNHESPATQAFVQRVCQYWLQEYRFDGYRFDLSKGFTQKNSGGDVAAWGAYDASRVAIWKRIYDQIRQYDPTAYVVLEHFADNTEERELADYGMLFWGNANGDFRAAAKGLSANINSLSYKQRGWNSPNLVGYQESHDEERIIYDVLTNGRTEGSYNTKTLATALERAKVATAFFLATPGPKLIWQFGELGYDVSINQNGRTGAKPVKWDYAQDASRRKLLRVYQEFIKLKLTQPAFRATDFALDGSGLVKRLTLNHDTQTAFLIGNFDVLPQSVVPGFPKGGLWYDYFTGKEANVTDVNAQVPLQPGEFHLFSTTKLPTPEAGIVPWTDALAVVTGVETEPAELVNVMPNPTAETAIVELTGAYRGPVAVQLSNTSGQPFRSQIVHKMAFTLRQPISLQGLPAGTYFLRIRQGEGKPVVKKLVKW